MIKPIIKVASVLAIIILITVITVFAVKVIKDNNDKNRTTSQVETSTSTSKLCISGFYPSNYPDFKAADIQNYFNDVNQAAGTYGIHTGYEDLTQIDLATTYLNPSIDINLVIGTKDNIWKDKSDDIVNALSKQIDLHKQIKSVGVGNEINNSFTQGSTEYNDFLDTYKDIYTKLKAKYPNLQVYTVFQYELLLGKGHLTGQESNISKVAMISDFAQYSDLIGITSYPFFDYKNPNDIPETYYQPLIQFNKSVLITETGWPSQALDGNQDTFNSSESIQTSYLQRLISITQKQGGFSKLCWLGVNDLIYWIAGNNNLRIFNNIGLKDGKGNAKEVWGEWGRSKF